MVRAIAKSFNTFSCKIRRNIIKIQEGYLWSNSKISKFFLIKLRGAILYNFFLIKSRGAIAPRGINVAPPFPIIIYYYKREIFFEKELLS